MFNPVRTGKSIRTFIWLAVLLAFLPAGRAALGQTPSYAGAYKAWSTTEEGKGIDSTLYLNSDGSALLVDDSLLGAAPTTRSGRWAPGPNNVSLTLTNDAAGPLPQPLAVTLDAAAGEPLVTPPGDVTLDPRGRRYYALAYLAENRNTLPYSADIAASTIAANGLAGAYKALVPGGNGWLDLTLTLFPDFRVVLERDALDGRAPSMTYGAWQDVGGQPTLTLTEADGVAFPTPATLTLAVENGILRALTAESSAVAELVGVPFYRVEGLANAVSIPAVPVITAPDGTIVTETALLTPTVEVTPTGEVTDTTLLAETPELSAPDGTVITDTVALPPLPAAVVVQYEPVFTAEPCPAGIQLDETVTCGYLTVPENRGRADSGSVRLFAATLAAQGDTPAPDPLIVLAGGAGEDPTTVIEWFVDAPVREDRSVIVLHPRGTGLSQPSLDCTEFADGADNAADLQSLADCYNRLLGEGRDLAGFSLDQQAFDVIDLAKALRLPQFNVLGSGMGAAVAQLAADREPVFVRSVTLESPVPVGANSSLERPIGTYDALRRVIADCGRDPACAAAYPALEVRFLQSIDWYAQNPLPDSIGYGDGRAIAQMVFAALQSGGSEVPALIDALYTGDFGTACKIAPVAGGCQLPATSVPAPISAVTASTPITEGMLVITGAPDQAAVTPPVPDAPRTWRDYFTDPDSPAGLEEATLAQLQRELGFATRDELVAFLDGLALENFLPLLEATSSIAGQTAQPISEGARLAILCAEDAPRYTVEDLQRVAARLPSQVAPALVEPALELLSQCSLWITPPAAAGDRIVETSMAPALVIAGAYDPVTPVRWARRAAADFEQPYVRIFPAAGGNLLALGDGCAQQMLAAFVDQPDRAPNLYCFRSQTREFLLPSP